MKSLRNIFLITICLTAFISINFNSPVKSQDFPDDLTGPLEILPGQTVKNATFFRNGYDFILCRGKNFQDSPPDFPVFLENKSTGKWNNETIQELMDSRGNKKELQMVLLKMKAAVDKDPQFLAFVYNYGRILQILNRHEEAYQYFVRASSLLPALASSSTNAGISLSKTDKKHSAVYHLKIAAKTNPLDTAPVLSLGEFYLNEKSFVKAEYYFRHLLAEHPDLPGAVFGLAKLYYAKSDITNARKYFDMIEVEDELGNPYPHSPIIFSKRAAFYKNIGEHEKSLSDLKTLLKYRSVLFLYGIDINILENKIKTEEERDNRNG